MNSKNKKIFITAICLFAMFALWTLAVCLLDVKTIGPNESKVGLAGMNLAFHNVTGVHMRLYTLTDWLGLVPFAFVFGFGVLGLVQWIKRKKLVSVDYSILALGGFYVVTMVTYILFEYVVINYRPVLINGYLEASYPSSTTMLVLCVMPTAMMQFHQRIRCGVLRWCVLIVIAAFTLFMVIGRLVSGVHWFTDIVGGILISASLVALYHAVCKMK